MNVNKMFEDSDVRMAIVAGFARVPARHNQRTQCTETRSGDAYHRFGIMVRGEKHYFLSHRVSWALANNQEVPDGMDVAHTCDNSRCINPAHLELATRSKNIKDCYLRGRRGDLRNIGRYYGAEIYARYLAGGITQQELADEWEVARPYICKIIRQEREKATLRKVA